MKGNKLMGATRWSLWPRRLGLLIHGQHIYGLTQLVPNSSNPKHPLIKAIRLICYLTEVPHRQHPPSPSPYQNPSLELSQDPHLHPPPSPSVEPFLALLPLFLVLPQDLPEGLIQAPPQDLHEGLLQAPPHDHPEGLLQTPYQTRQNLAGRQQGSRARGLAMAVRP
uniref:Uncharacterized protein n=1 Tax=Tanacetum cinerariifolium TaxID=118510 RepID=A0A6L2L073_TANCI|nr:hypothetical protein [Tanacetum cinerariifolium]